MYSGKQKDPIESSLNWDTLVGLIMHKVGLKEIELTKDDLVEVACLGKAIEVIFRADRVIFTLLNKEEKTKIIKSRINEEPGDRN